MIRYLLALIVMFALASPVAAQTNACDTDDSGPFVVTTGKAFVVTWCQVPSRTQPDGTVSDRYDGFYLQIDNGQKFDVGLPNPGPVSLVTGRIPYSVSAGGVQKGTHVVTVTAYVVVLDETGASTTQRLESAPTAVPFSAAEPVVNLPPPAPSGVRVRRQ
jgi:hypothetical protein